MLEHLLPDQAGDTSLGHLSLIPHWDDSPVIKFLYFDIFARLALSQEEANEALARMLKRLESVGVVGRAESPSDSLLGFEHTDAVHVCDYLLKKSGVSHWPFGCWPLADVGARVLRSTVQRPCLHCSLNSSACSSMLIHL